MAQCFKDGCEREAGWQAAVCLWPKTPFGDPSYAELELREPIYACDQHRVKDQTIDPAAIVTNDLWQEIERALALFGQTCQAIRSDVAVEYRVRQRK